MAHGSEEGPTGQKVAAAGSMHTGAKRVEDNRMGARTRSVLRRVAKPTTDEPEWTLLSHTLHDKYARPLVDTRSPGVCSNGSGDSFFPQWNCNEYNILNHFRSDESL